MCKLQSREAQFIHELRKKDLIFVSIQEQLKKLQKEKNINYLNNFVSPPQLISPNSMKVSFFYIGIILTKFNQRWRKIIILMAFKN